jgi:hypothetical protein
MGGSYLDGSLRLNLTQHGETHQVNERLLQGLGLEQRDEFASAAINSCREVPYFGHERPLREQPFAVRHQLVQGMPPLRREPCGLSERPTLWRVQVALNRRNAR